MPCEKGENCTCKNHEKPYCKYWIPGRSSKYYKCARFAALRVTCDLPKEDCATCEHFIAELPGKEATIDWDDKEQVREYRAAYMRRYRKIVKIRKLRAMIKEEEAASDPARDTEEV